jgi:predicted nucleic acid-binding protein
LIACVPILIAWHPKTQNLVPELVRHPRGVIDTSIVIDLEKIDPLRLPAELAVSSLTMAELAAGPHATNDSAERARRQDRLQRAEAVFDPLPFDAEAARCYGRVFAAISATGRKARGARAVDLLIAATACAAGLPLYTRNFEDLRGLEGVVEIIAI